MPRTPTPVNRAALEKSVAEADKANPPHFKALCLKAEDLYNNKYKSANDPLISFQVVGLRIKEWGIACSMHAPMQSVERDDPGKAPVRPVERPRKESGPIARPTPTDAPTGRQTPFLTAPGFDPARMAGGGNAVPAGCVPIWAPAGACPIKLAGIGESDVIGWARSLREVFLGRREWLTANALSYFARTILDWDTQEYRTVAGIIVANFGEE